MNKCFICKRFLKHYKRIDNVNIYECSNCQLSFINNRNISLKKRVAKLNKIYNYHSYLKENEKLSKRFNKLSEIIIQYKNKGKLLDIGSGHGLFDAIIDRLGKYDISLIEPFQKVELFNKGKIYKKTFSNFIKKNNCKYDLITMLDVLEHFNYPIYILKSLSDIGKTRSILVIQTPNYMSLMAKICGNWSWWMVEDHKYIFSPNSIKLLLKLAGYKIKYFVTYEDLNDFKKNLDGNFTDIRNNYCRKLIKALFFVVFMPIYFIFRYILWKLGYGGLIFLIAEKQ